MTTALKQRLIRSTLAYALFVSGLPVLQSAAFVPAGWTESRILLALYVLGPILAAWLVHKGFARPGAILMLGFVSSGVVINGLLLDQIQPPEFAPAHWIVVLRVWILVLMVVNVLLAWTSFQVLREIHRTPPSHVPPPTV